MAFPTNLKDEIKADGITAKQYKQIDVISGASLNGGNPIVLQRYDKPKQQGSVLNAKMVNAIHQRFNDLEDGTAKVSKAGMLETLNENGNMHGITPYYSEDGVIKFKVDATADLPVGNSVRVGNARVFAYTTVANPAGNDYVVLPLPQGFMGTLIYLNVQNTNIYASRAIVVGATIEGNGITTVFNGAYAGNIQLSVLALTV